MQYKHVKPWLKPLNKYILQWFFIRLAVSIDTNCYTSNGVDLSVPVKFKILKWVVPTTGWVTNYKFVGKRKI